MTKLGNGAAFFASVKAANLLGSSLDQSEVDGVNAILAACGAAGWGPKWTAYALATADRLAGRPCWVGVDLASNLDMTAAAFVFKERDGSYAVEWKYWQNARGNNVL